MGAGERLTGAVSSHQCGRGLCYIDSTDSMDPAQLRSELKRLIVVELNLKGRDPDSIEDDAPLFGEGLGLDSLDALQLAMSVEEKFNARIPEGDAARAVFQSVRTLAEHVAKARSA